MFRQQVGIELTCLRIDCGFTIVIPLGKMFRCFSAATAAEPPTAKLPTLTRVIAASSKRKCPIA